MNDPSTSEDGTTEPTTAVIGSVRGRVQGVNFRRAMQLEANRLGVTGWVQNLPDRSVAFHAEGSRSGIDALMAWCRTGPMFARIDDLEFEHRSITHLSTFEILR
jgi:acylphosphatase